VSISASASTRGVFDVGAVEWDHPVLIEVDASGRRRRAEVFARPRLGDAVARLYERYADLLPDGSARTRAAATGRSIAAMMAPTEDFDRYNAAIAPTVEFVDHRTVGIGSGRGAEAFREWDRSLLEVAENLAFRVDDILCLRPDALLIRWTNSGTLRAGGGAYERCLLMLWMYGPDGLLTRYEQFDANCDHEALARFEELTAGPADVRFAAAPPRVAKKLERRVRSNAATAFLARYDAAVAARDTDAFPTLLADGYEVVDHTTGVTWDRQGDLASFRAFVRARDPRCRHEPLATLGDSLALCRESLSASAFAGRTFDVGAYEREVIDLVELDAQGPGRRVEQFAPDCLGDAVALLYERYAELLPDGPAHARAAATARSAAALLGPPDIDRWAATLAPAVEFVDHRLLGFGSTRGAEALLRGLRTLFEVAEDLAPRVDDILSLRSDAFLVRWTTSGTVRVSGGAFEWDLLVLWVFGADGLLTRWEQFEVEDDASALARFDELTAPSVARFENTASRWRRSPARGGARVSPRPGMARPGIRPPARRSGRAPWRRPRPRTAPSASRGRRLRRPRAGRGSARRRRR